MFLHVHVRNAKPLIYLPGSTLVNNPFIMPYSCPSAGAVNAVPRVKRLQGDLSEADTLPMTADPAGGAPQVLPELPSVVCCC
jgi:hypothetical protein